MLASFRSGNFVARPPKQGGEGGADWDRDVWQEPVVPELKLPSRSRKHHAPSEGSFAVPIWSPGRGCIEYGYSTEYVHLALLMGLLVVLLTSQASYSPPRRIGSGTKETSPAENGQ